MFEQRPVVIQRQIIDHALQRRALLAEVASGKTSLAEVREADIYLLRAASYHGEQLDRLCPLCTTQEPLVSVLWVFGEHLGTINNSARSRFQVAEMSGTQREFTVHEVEVCVHCRWNHLVVSYVTGINEIVFGNRKRKSGSSMEKKL